MQGEGQGRAQHLIMGTRTSSASKNSDLLASRRRPGRTPAPAQLPATPAGHPVHSATQSATYSSPSCGCVAFGWHQFAA